MSRRPNVPASPADEHTMMTWPVGVRTTRRWPKAGLTATGVASRRPRPMEREREITLARRCAIPFSCRRAEQGSQYPARSATNAPGPGLRRDPAGGCFSPTGVTVMRLQPKPSSGSGASHMRGGFTWSEPSNLLGSQFKIVRLHLLDLLATPPSRCTLGPPTVGPRDHVVCEGLIVPQRAVAGIQLQGLR